MRKSWFNKKIEILQDQFQQKLKIYLDNHNIYNLYSKYLGHFYQLLQFKNEENIKQKIHFNFRKIEVEDITQKIKDNCDSDHECVEGEYNKLITFLEVAWIMILFR